MLATLTSKGQVTLPKEIRDALDLDAGAKLDFQLEADGTLRVRALKRSAVAIVGLLQAPAGAAPTPAEMDRAMVAHLATKHDRILREAAAASPARRKR